MESSIRDLPNEDEIMAQRVAKHYMMYRKQSLRHQQLKEQDLLQHHLLQLLEGLSVWRFEEIREFRRAAEEQRRRCNEYFVSHHNSSDENTSKRVARILVEHREEILETKNEWGQKYETISGTCSIRRFRKHIDFILADSFQGKTDLGSVVAFLEWIVIKAGRNMTRKDNPDTEQFANVFAQQVMTHKILDDSVNDWLQLFGGWEYLLCSKYRVAADRDEPSCSARKRFLAGKSSATELKASTPSGRGKYRDAFDQDEPSRSAKKRSLTREASAAESKASTSTGRGKNRDVVHQDEMSISAKRRSLMGESSATEPKASTSSGRGKGRDAVDQDEPSRSAKKRSLTGEAGAAEPKASTSQGRGKDRDVVHQDEMSRSAKRRSLIGESSEIEPKASTSSSRGKGRDSVDQDKPSGSAKKTLFTGEAGATEPKASTSTFTRDSEESEDSDDSETQVEPERPRETDTPTTVRGRYTRKCCSRKHRPDCNQGESFGQCNKCHGVWCGICRRGPFTDLDAYRTHRVEMHSGFDFRPPPAGNDDGPCCSVENKPPRDNIKSKYGKCKTCSNVYCRMSMLCPFFAVNGNIPAFANHKQQKHGGEKPGLTTCGGCFRQKIKRPAKRYCQCACGLFYCTMEDCNVEFTWNPTTSFSISRHYEKVHRLPDVVVPTDINMSKAKSFTNSVLY